jgi:hypothetical protein
VPQDGSADEPPPAGVPERRRYNRRTTTSEPSPPYFEVFERMAIALEGIQESLRNRETSRGPEQ